MSGWDFDKSGDKVEFTKFPVGITKIRVIDEEPHVRWTHWMPASKLKGVTGAGRSVNCPGKGCPICEIRKQQKANGEKYTYNMTRRFSINIINRETGRVEIMEQGITFFEDLRDMLADLSEEGKTLIDADLKVRRRGTNQDDTSYRIDIEEKYPLSDKDKEMMKQRVDLNDYFKPHTPEQLLRLINGEEWDEVMKREEEEEQEDIEIE